MELDEPIARLLDPEDPAERSARAVVEGNLDACRGVLTRASEEGWTMSMMENYVKVCMIVPCRPFMTAAAGAGSERGDTGRSEEEELLGEQLEATFMVSILCCRGWLKASRRVDVSTKSRYVEDLNEKERQCIIFKENTPGGQQPPAPCPIWMMNERNR
eukprot:768788-Hanusia_phi.AAC.4